ncbi:MAG: AMP-binding protein [Deltaproteobacteria bacterium]|nr:AMP-binding protein [Deltaproteobacteria bacterium]
MVTSQQLAVADADASPRIFDAFLEAARRHPRAPAIVHPRGAWSYEQVEAASRALALQLLAQPGDDDVVALYARRSGELVVGMLACLRAGLTFAVLDAAYPRERIELLLGVLAPGRCVAFGTHGEMPAFPRDVLHFDDAGFDELLGTAAVRDARLDGASPGSIAYLLFTSGTTGTPKCIATAHAPLVHFIDWYARRFEVDASCRFSMLSGLGHDPVLRDVFVPLSTGAALHIPPPATVLDPAQLYAWLAEARITHAHVTPQLARIACAGRRGRGALAALRFVCSGGDKLRPRQADELRAVAPSVQVVNFYGSTETPQAMGHHVYDPATDASGETVPIGRGIDDVELLVIDDALAPLPALARGQIAIRTRYLSAGYRGDPELTNAKFVGDLYLTGDVGHRRADGAIVIEGRLDDQVKIRGFRVELADVTAQLLRLSAVTDAVVLAEKMPDGESRLAAYLVGTGATSEVRAAMTATAPAYMVPARFTWLERLPLLPNGKLDRAALRALPGDEPAAPSGPGGQELDPTEARIAADWRAILGRTHIDTGASFVELGGDSLSFIEASVRLEELLGRLPDGWERMPIRALARAGQATRSRWTSVDASVLLRAISIVAVVVGHFELPNLAGSVIALFVVSGMSFGRYLAPQITQADGVAPVVRLFAKIAIPTVLYSLIVNTAMRLPKLPGLLLSNNLVSDDSRVSGIGFWYIDVLLQCFVVLALLLSIPRVRRAIAGDPFQLLVGATLAFTAVSVAAPYLWDTTHLADRVPQRYLGAVFLGWTLIHATTRPRKLVVLALAALAFADFAWKSDDYLFFPFVATAFLLACRRVSLPLLVGRVITVIASASLFIYLTDHQVELVLLKVGIPHGALMVALAVVAGIVVWKVWELAVALTKRVRA